MPHDHRHVLATFHKAGPAEVDQAIRAAASAHREWASWASKTVVPFSSPRNCSAHHGGTLNGATMLNQSRPRIRPNRRRLRDN